MIKEILNRIVIGIATGGFLTFVVLTFMKFLGIEGTASEVWNHMLGSMVLGVYFALSSLIYEYDGWSPLKKTVTHYSLSILVYFLVALPIGWIPWNLLSVVVGILAFSVLYALYWTGFLLYFKKVEASLNKQLQKEE